MQNDNLAIRVRDLERDYEVVKEIKKEVILLNSFRDKALGSIITIKWLSGGIFSMEVVRAIISIIVHT